MSEMIDRLATTLHDAMCKQDIDGYLRADIDCYELARLAMEAVREPTREMIQETCSGYPLQVWRSMVNIALAPSLPSQPRGGSDGPA